MSDFHAGIMTPVLRVLFYSRFVPPFIRQVKKLDFTYDLHVDAEIDGVKFRVYPGQNHHDRLIHRGVLFEEERGEMAFMREALKDGGVFVDIGANIGAVCIPLAINASNVRVIAVEPNPVNAERLRYNASINGLENVEVMCCAAGPEGTLTLRSPGRYNSGQLSARPHIGKVRQDISMTVPCKPLSQILRECGASSVRLLKIDVEGFEDQVIVPFLKESEEALWPEHIALEHASSSRWEEDCLQALQNAGYTVELQTELNTCLGRY